MKVKKTAWYDVNPRAYLQSPSRQKLTAGEARQLREAIKGLNGKKATVRKVIR